MSGTVNTLNPEDVIPAGRSAWRKRSRLPTSSFASHPESCSVYICERKKNVCGHVFYIFFFFSVTLLFVMIFGIRNSYGTTPQRFQKVYSALFSQPL